MDLSTIEKRFKNKFYLNGSEAFNDFVLMFRNCLVYNNHEDDVVKMARNLMKIFTAEIKKMPKIETVIADTVERRANDSPFVIIPLNTVENYQLNEFITDSTQNAGEKLVQIREPSRQVIE